MKEKNTFRNSSKTALGGIVAALSVAMMFLTAVIPTLTYTLPAAAGILLIIVVIEIDKRWALGVYAAVSILSLLVLPDKEAAMIYVFFCGHYPIVKALLEGKLQNRVLLWILKFLIFNVSIVAAYMIIIYVFQLPLEDMETFGKWSAWVLLGLGNIVFLVYDFLLSRLVTLYMLKWHKAFRKILKF